MNQVPFLSWLTATREPSELGTQDSAAPRQPFPGIQALPDTHFQGSLDSGALRKGSGEGLLKLSFSVGNPGSLSGQAFTEYFSVFLKVMFTG